MSFDIKQGNEHKKKNWEKYVAIGNDNNKYDEVYKEFLKKLAERIIDFDGAVCDECIFQGDACSLLVENNDTCTIGMILMLDKEVSKDEEI